MSKYDPLWNWIKENGTDSFKLTYAEIEEIAGLPIDHSFINIHNNQLHGFPRGGMGILDSNIMEKATEVICKWIQF